MKTECITVIKQVQSYSRWRTAYRREGDSTCGRCVFFFRQGDIRLPMLPGNSSREMPDSKGTMGMCTRVVFGDGEPVHASSADRCCEFFSRRLLFYRDK